MSTIIRLEFAHDIDVELAKADYWLPIVRVIANVRLLSKDDSASRAYKAILDTGSPITIIPKSIWRYARTQLLVKEAIRFGGLGEGEISGRIAHVWVCFVDEKRSSRTMEIPAFLAANDRTPLIIGFHKTLSENKLICDYRNDRGFLAIRSPSKSTTFWGRRSPCW